MVNITPHDRDEQVLSHIGLYRITLRHVLARVFFDGGNPGNLIQRLLSEGRITVRQGLPSRVSYYQLSLAEVRRRGLPADRSRPPHGQALASHLGALWYCSEPGTQRRRLETHELQQLFGSDHARVPHCIEAGSPPHILRIQVVAPRASLPTAVRMLRRRIERLREHTVLGPWIRNRQYCFLMLADDSRRAEGLRRLLHERGADRRAEIVVGEAPSIDGLPGVLRRLAPEHVPQAATLWSPDG